MLVLVLQLKEGVRMLIAKVARIVLLPGVMLSLCSAHSSAAPIVSIEPPVQFVEPGQSFAVDVLISSVADLYAFQLDLGFDPFILVATGVTEGPFLPARGTTAFISGIIDED